MGLYSATKICFRGADVMTHPASKPMFLCSTCREPAERAGQRHCRKCHASYQRIYRLREREKIQRLRKLVRELTEAVS